MMAKHQAAVPGHGLFWLHLILYLKVSHLWTEQERLSDYSKKISKSKHVASWGFWIKANLQPYKHTKI